MRSPTTNSTGSPEPSAEPPEPAAADPQLGLLLELESSLKASQEALLSRDVTRLEQLTAEQIRVRQRLSALRRHDGGHSWDRPSQDLYMAATRVLHLGRVQSVLLERAQLSLRILSHLMAGKHATYSPSLAIYHAGAARNLLPPKEV